MVRTRERERERERVEGEEKELHHLKQQIRASLKSMGMGGTGAGV